MTNDAVGRALQQWETERPDLDTLAMGVLGRLTRAAHVATGWTQDYLAQHDLTPWEFDVLATLRRSRSDAPLTSGQLADMTMVGSAATTRRVDRLVERGLIERQTNERNRREVLVRLSPAGEELVEKALGGHVENQHRMLRSLDRTQQRELSDLLRAFLLAHDDG